VPNTKLWVKYSLSPGDPTVQTPGPGFKNCIIVNPILFPSFGKAILKM